MKTIGIWFVSLSICFLAVFMIGCDATSTTSTTELTIAPTSAYLSAAAVTIVTFTATGGDSNYTWTVSNSALGTLHTAGGTALYQSVAIAGTNTVTVTDGSGDIGSATVTQQ